MLSHRKVVRVLNLHAEHEICTRDVTTAPAESLAVSLTIDALMRLPEVASAALFSS